MRELNKLKQELLIMKTNNIKPNYAELARIHNCDYRTVKKYDNGYEGKPTTREKESKLDKYKDEIKSKLELPGKELMNFLKQKIIQLVIILIFINIQKIIILRKKIIIVFIQDMKLNLVNNYNLIGRKK